MEELEYKCYKYMTKRSWWLNIWFWWFVLTLVYVLSILSGALKGLDGSANLFNRFTAFIGLFVPFGFFNFLFSIQMGFLVATFPIFIFGMIITEHYKKSSDSGVFKSIILNLVTLFVITFIVDIILWSGWNSWFIFIGKEVQTY